MSADGKEGRVTTAARARECHPTVARTALRAYVEGDLARREVRRYVDRPNPLREPFVIPYSGSDGEIAYSRWEVIAIAGDLFGR